MAAYVDLVGQADGDNIGLIREWANRDQNVLRQGIVTSSLDWAADKAYRLLRIPPLEITRTYTINDDANLVNSGFRGGQTLTVRVPSDMSELMYIRNLDGTTGDRDLNIVYNERVDTRTFNDGLAETQDFYFYTRIGDDYKIHGNFNTGDVLEFHYYRRLPALDATYSKTRANYMAGRGTLDGVRSTDTGAPTYATDAAFEAATPGVWVGDEARHWLRDENERILLYGALWKAFIFLHEPDELVKYQQLFHAEIEELNREETMRKSRGGNIVVSYQGRGLI